MRRSFMSSAKSTSSACGITATVAVEVWMRPWVSVSGTRCTRCTPLSYLRRLYAPAPSTETMASFTPPSSVSFRLSTSSVQPRFWAYMVYIRSRLWANRAASSPPAPLRISMMTFLPSFTSLGNSKILRLFSSFATS